MKLNKIEGDAAFFYVESLKPKDEAFNILRFMRLANDNFKCKLSKLQVVRRFAYDQCLQAKYIILKLEVH